MKSFTSFLSKGEALAKQVASQAVELAEKAKQEEWVKQVSEQVSTRVTGAVDVIKAEYTQAVSDYKEALNIATPVVRDLGNRFISIDFPSERIIDSLGAVLRERYQDNILIINMSERDFDEDKMPGHVLSVSFRGLPAPPLELTCRMCLQIHQWLSRSPSNVVAIHCFPGLSRTAVFLCCYFAWSGACIHPVDALVDICSGLKIDVDSNPILPSQKRYLSYFFEYLTNDSLPAVPPLPLSLTKLILNGVPNLPIAEDALFRPFFEIWKDGRLEFTSLPPEAKSMTPQELAGCVQAYPIVKDAISTEDTCVASFDLQEPVTVNGDLLIRIRHLSESSAARYTCLRFGFNTNHVSNGLLHLGKQEIDGNTFHHCVIDALFKPATAQAAGVEDAEETERIRDILTKSKELSLKLRLNAEIPEMTTIDGENLLAPQVIGRQEGERIEGEATPSTPVDDVDDFFAQLEKDAQI